MATNKKTYLTVITFLILEVLAFVSFTLTNSVILYAIAGFGLLFAMIFINLDKMKAKDFSPIGWILIPLVIFALLNIVSSFNSITNGMSISLLSSVGLLSFFGLGYLSQSNPYFTMKKGMLVIYSAIAVLAILSLIMTFISYTPFYTITYSGMYIYYQGTRIALGDSAKMLFGFSIADVSVQYFQLFGTLLFSSVIGLRFINPKTQTREFIIYCVYAILGLISILFTINKMNILSSILVIIFLPLIAFWPKKKKICDAYSYIFYGLVGLCVIGVLIFILNALKVSFVSDIIASNALLDKLFNTNRISASWVEIIQKTFNFNNILGLSPVYTKDVISSGNIFLDMFETTGLFGGIAFIVFFVMAFRQICKYFKSNRDDELTRTLIIGFIGVFFIYNLFCYDLTPIKDNMDPFTVLPVQFNGLFMIVLFLIGYTFEFKKEEQKVVETETRNDEIIIDAEVVTYEE